MQVSRPNIKCEAWKITNEVESDEVIQNCCHCPLLQHKLLHTFHFKQLRHSYLTKIGFPPSHSLSVSLGSFSMEFAI